MIPSFFFFFFLQRYFVDMIMILLKMLVVSIFYLIESDRQSRLKTTLVLFQFPLGLSQILKCYDYMIRYFESMTMLYAVVACRLQIPRDIEQKTSSRRRIDVSRADLGIDY